MVTKRRRQFRSTFRWSGNRLRHANAHGAAEIFEVILFRIGGTNAHQLRNSAAARTTRSGCESGRENRTELLDLAHQVLRSHLKFT